jgi:hypothetical protein
MSFNSTNNNSKSNINTKKSGNDKPQSNSSRLPGVNDKDIIQSSPDLVKENSYKIKKK